MNRPTARPPNQHVAELVKSQLRRATHTVAVTAAAAFPPRPPGHLGYQTGTPVPLHDLQVLGWYRDALQGRIAGAIAAARAAGEPWERITAWLPPGTLSPREVWDLARDPAGELQYVCDACGKLITERGGPLGEGLPGAVDGHSESCAAVHE